VTWLAQLSSMPWIAVASAAPSASGAIIAAWVARRATRKSCDQQYFLEYARRYRELISQAPPDIRDPCFQLSKRSDRELILRLTHDYLDLCFEQWHLHQRGLITSKLWMFWKNAMIAGFSRPAFQQAWIMIRAEKRCDPEFLLFVERHAAKDSGERGAPWRNDVRERAR